MASRKAEEFLTEIREVMRKYGAALAEADDYTGQEDYAGTRKYVVVDGERFELDELLREI